VGGGKAAPVASKYLLPETVLHTERLRQTNAEVDYSAAAIKSRRVGLFPGESIRKLLQ